MDEILFPFFEDVNDGTAQALYLEAFGSEEVQSGICLSLVLAWINIYKGNDKIAPNTVWNQMKNPATLKQIANNQKQYIKDNDVRVFISEYKLVILDTVAFGLAADIPFFTPACLQHSNILVIVIDLSKNNELVGAHAIGIIQHKNMVYMFDPNEGVMCAPSRFLKFLISLISYIYEEKYGYRICGREIFVIE